MKKWAIVQVVIIVAAVGVGMFFMHQTTNSGIADIKTVYEFANLDVVIDKNSNTAKNLREAKETMFSRIEKDSMLYHSDRQILIVSPTKDMRQYYGGFTQLVTVEQVVEGDADLVKQKMDIYVYGGLTLIGESLSMQTYDSKNIMLPENSYMVFCEKTEISDYRDTPLYRVIPGGFNYFNLTSDYSFIKKGGVKQPYSLFKDSEFCFVSQETLDVLLEYKKEIMDQFNVQQ